MRLRLIPREERFFDLFVEDAANVLGAARLLEAMLRSYDQIERRAGEIRDAEHRGDEISHEIGLASSRPSSRRSIARRSTG